MEWVTEGLYAVVSSVGTHRLHTDRQSHFIRSSLHRLVSAFFFLTLSPNPSQIWYQSLQSHLNPTSFGGIQLVQSQRFVGLQKTNINHPSTSICNCFVSHTETAATRSHRPVWHLFVDPGGQNRAMTRLVHLPKLRAHIVAPCLAAAHSSLHQNQHLHFFFVAATAAWGEVVRDPCESPLRVNLPLRVSTTTWQRASGWILASELLIVLIETGEHVPLFSSINIVLAVAPFPPEYTGFSWLNVLQPPPHTHTLHNWYDNCLPPPVWMMRLISTVESKDQRAPLLKRRDYFLTINWQIRSS